ncbi:MAG: prepilin-type N-terminal cleavage/methylation domain-containing protein [Tissierella sp.]|uniref:prepilin-type N-terminal cleavage/methylation domain-containing protein n=1 Tax=Tissierella sp. TaxID=41274 RepID=UPI003F9D378A
MNNKRGYTLVELVVIIAILAIIVIMTIPNTGYFKSMMESSELKEFKRDIMFARNKAIVESKIYILKLMNDDNGYIVKSSSKSGFEKIKYFENGIVLNKNNNCDDIHFNSNGTVSNAKTISLHDRKGKEYRLVITPIRGLVDIKESDK